LESKFRPTGTLWPSLAPPGKPVEMSNTERSMTVAQVEMPEAEIAQVCQRSGIRKLALFGSVLADRFSESSDIDVLVEFQPHSHVGFFRLADIEHELSRLLGGRRVDLRTPMDLGRHFREQVVREALTVYAER
jgi:predicted nucleotidyltransferase